MFLLKNIPCGKEKLFLHYFIYCSFRKSIKLGIYCNMSVASFLAKFQLWYSCTSTRINHLNIAPRCIRNQDYCTKIVWASSREYLSSGFP